MPEFLVFDPGPRPSYVKVAEHLWGANCDFDSDGDSQPNDADDWTELTLICRPELVERIDIDLLDGYERLVLRVVSENEALAQKAATFLADQSGGELKRSPPQER